MANMWRAALIAGGLLVAGSATAAQLSGRASAAAGADGRVAHSVVRRECAAGSPMTPLGLSSAGTSGTSVGRWSSPTPLVPAGTATPSIGLAATSGGSVLAGWVQGPPPMVFAGGAFRSSARESRASKAHASSSTQEVTVADGTVLGGLRRSAVLAAGPSGSLTSLYVTVSTPDVGYVVWEGPSTSLRLGVVCSGKIVVADRQLVADAVPLALFPLAGGRAAVVFDKYGHGTPFLEYGLLSATGRISRIARIAHPGSRDTAATELSVNPRGELIAAWVHDDAASPREPHQVPAGSFQRSWSLPCVDRHCAVRHRRRSGWGQPSRRASIPRSRSAPTAPLP